MDYNNWRNVSYLETIQNIENILYKENIFPIIDNWYWNSNWQVFQCKAWEQTKKKCACGKGRSFLAAKASAEAELIERIQAGLFFPDSVNNFIFKDEIIDKQNKKYLPVFNLITNKTESYEYSTNLVHSNGFAAGNTINEAICHSICEIVERLALNNFCQNKIHWNNVIEAQGELKNNILKLEQDLSGQAYLIDISDKGIPTVLFYFTSFIYPNMVLFNIQTGINIQMAIERCLTETFQLSNKIKENFFTIVNLPNNKQIANAFSILHFTGGVLNSFFPKDWHDNILEYFYSLPKKTFKEYSEFNSEKDFIQFFIKNYQSYFGNIYIRDFSWLNFPTIKIITEKNNLELNYLDSMYDDLMEFFILGIKNYYSDYSKHILSEFLENFNLFMSPGMVQPEQFQNQKNNSTMKNKIDLYNDGLLYEKKQPLIFPQQQFFEKIENFSMDMSKFNNLLS